MLTSAGRDAFLDVIRGTNHWIGLFTAVSNWRTPTVTEATYTGYARVQMTATTDWTQGDLGSPAVGRRIFNANEESFPQNTGSAQDVVAWGVNTASTAGTWRWIVALDDDPPIVGTVATTNTITAYAHGLVADQRVYVLGIPGAPFPTGFAEGTAYFVRATGLTSDTFTLATTSGGAAVDVTLGSAALFIPYKAVTIANNATPRFAAGALELAL